MGMLGATKLRQRFDATAGSLVGVCIDNVDYWDLHSFSTGPREWDHGAWHHAVMGVGLSTSAGPVSVTWTSTFHPYGVEVLTAPMTDFVVHHDRGPEVWPVTHHPEWTERAGQPITAVETFWDSLQLGPARYADGRLAEPPRTVDVPVALRLDFEAGPVWFVAGIPAEDGTLFVGGDEIVVAFTSEAMLRLGFPTGGFTAAPTRRER